VHLVADVEEVALGYVLGFGDTVEVLAPPALRQRVLTTARNVVAFYEGRGGEGRSS